MSGPQPIHMSKRDVNSRRIATFSALGQVWVGPSELDAQSWARIKRAISPSPTKMSSAGRWVTGGSELKVVSLVECWGRDASARERPRGLPPRAQEWPRLAPHATRPMRRRAYGAGLAPADRTG